MDTIKDHDPLQRVRVSRMMRDAADHAFRDDVRSAKRAGHSMREIAKAAGYTSHAPVQNILRKRAQT